MLVGVLLFCGYLSSTKRSMLIERIKIKRAYYSVWVFFGVATLSFIDTPSLDRIGKNPFISAEVWIFFIILLIAFILDLLIISPVGIKEFNIAGIRFVSEEDIDQIKELTYQFERFDEWIQKMASAEHVLLLQVMSVADRINNVISDDGYIDLTVEYGDILKKYCLETNTDLDAELVEEEFVDEFHLNENTKCELKTAIASLNPYSFRIGSKFYTVVPYKSLLLGGLKLIILSTRNKTGTTLIEQLAVQNILIKLEENILSPDNE